MLEACITVNCAHCPSTFGVSLGSHAWHVSPNLLGGTFEKSFVLEGTYILT
jgi:hypothetical protein